MSKCVDNVNGESKDLELLYKNKYIMDVKKVDKSSDLFAIKTLDAELNKSAPIKVDENGAITSIILSSNKGRYYSDEPPNIIIRQPASPEGKPAKATAFMKKGGDTLNEYWEIDNIKVDDGGSGYDAIADIDKIEIEKKNTVQKKIVYNETKPIYYLLEKKQSQCNNLTDRWHDWFTIPYYYLGNNNGRRKIDESNKTRGVFQCYKKCNNKYVVNNDNVCESIQTLEGGKYRNYIPYDPLAIICILGSYETADYTPNSNVIKSSEVPGNYYYTIKNVKKGDDEDINTEVQTNILASLSNYKKNPLITTHPIAKIKENINEAYTEISNYISGIKTEAENNDLKIKTTIKNNVNDFYQLFDKRDELYISYLNKLKDSTHFKRVLYAKSIAHKVKDATPNEKYLQYLFKYCKFLYFNENNMFAIRLLNYGIYEEDYIKGTKENINITNPDEEDTNVLSKEPTKINYNPVTVKIDTKHKNMFDDYSNAYELYKSFILTYPIILLLSVGLFIIILIAYWSNFIYVFISALNFLYILVIGIVYLFIVLIACNSIVIKAVIFIITTIYQIVGALYSAVMDIFNMPIIGSIIKFILFIFIIITLMNSNLNFIYEIVMFFVNTIIYFILGIISIFIYIIYGFVSLNPGIIFPTLITMSILYAYYKIWFNFDINTLHKDAKKDAKIINEHSDSTTIFKSGALKFGVGATISKARLELYKYSYFMNLYENAYENYVEKIAEIEKYNKNLDDTDSDLSTRKEEEQANEKKKLTNKKEEFGEKVDKANIARAERRDAERELSDFDRKNDKTLKDINLDRITGNLGDNDIGNNKKIKRNEILEEKRELRKNIRELKTAEDSARNAIKGLQNKIPTMDKINMNKSVDTVKNAFDNIKIDPKAASDLLFKN